MGTTINPNQTLLQGRDQSTPDKTPAPLTGPSSYVTFEFKGVQPPSILYVNVDDKLVISAASSQTNEVVTINVRLLLPTGRMEDMQFQVRPANTRTVAPLTASLAEGYLVSMSCSAAVALTRGQTFVRASLQRSASGAGNPAQMLFADYVTTQATSAYPNGRILSPTEGPGFVRILTGTVPGAGVDAVLIVPTNARWRVRSLLASLTTSATVANRTPQLQWQIGGVFAATLPALAFQAAGTTVLYSAVGVTPYASAFTGDQVLPLPPDLILDSIVGGNMQIQFTTNNLQAGDQWGAIVALVEEWLDNV